MKVEYVDAKFSLLDNALVGDKKYILGSDETLCNLVDLCTYGLKFFPSITYEPLEFLRGDQMPLDKTEAEVIRKTLFPTMVDGDQEKPVSYYGSITSGSQKLYMISIPKGTKEVKFFEGDSLKIKVNIEGDPKDETLLWFVISKDMISDINLSRLSWLRSQIPHRNYENHVVGWSESIEVVENEGPFWIDRTSGTILANTESSGTPLLDLIKDRYSNDKSWSSKIHYRRGDTVLVNGVTWVAVRDNLGSFPTYSESWIPKTTIDSFKKDISIVSCSHGEVTPSIVPAPSSTSITIETLKLEPGYFLKGFLKQCYESYVNGTYKLSNIKVECTKDNGVLKVQTEEINPVIKVYINRVSDDKFDAAWPKNSPSDKDPTKELKVKFKKSFKTDSDLKTIEPIGRITRITKTYIGDNGEILGIDETVDSILIKEKTTPSIVDTVNLPCREIHYNVSLTYDYIQLIVEEYSGFYVNVLQQSSRTNEVKDFYLKPITPDITSCSVDILFPDADKATISVSPSELEDEHSIESTHVRLKKEGDLFILKVEYPFRNFKFNVYGS